MDEDGLAAFVAGLDGAWRGLSLTMPLKKAAVAVATDLVHPVPLLGVANTLLLDGARRTALNTDVSGLLAALVEAGSSTMTAATVLGAGATAVSAVAALAGLTDRVVVCARSPEKAQALPELGRRMGVSVELAPWSDVPANLAAGVVVSTTPAGASDAWVASVPDRPGLLFDVVYDPWPTPLASAWIGAGGRVLSGLDLLVHQAVDQVAAMTGRAVPVDVLRRALDT